MVEWYTLALEFKRSRVQTIHIHAPLQGYESPMGHALSRGLRCHNMVLLTQIEALCWHLLALAPTHLPGCRLCPACGPSSITSPVSSLLARRGGLHSRPATSPGISPGDHKKSSVIPSCGARRPEFPAVEVARHVARRRQEVLHDPFLRDDAACIPGRQRRPASRSATPRSPARSLLAGQGGLHSRPSASPGMSPGDDKKSPRRLCVGRGG